MYIASIIKNFPTLRYAVTVKMRNVNSGAVSYLKETFHSLNEIFDCFREYFSKEEGKALPPSQISKHSIVKMKIQIFNLNVL